MSQGTNNLKPNEEDCMPCEVSSDTNAEKEKLVSLIMGGDRQAVDLLFASYIPQLRRTATWMLPNSDDSEDALQDGLLLAYRHLNQFQGRAKFSTWLHRIVVNAALAKMRKQRSRPTTSIDQEAINKNDFGIADLLVDPRPNPEEEYIAEERSQILARMLEDLPARSRTVVHLMDIDGFPGKEAAQILGISPSALKARHHRARQSILRKMTESHEKPKMQ
jgi:RNA polymerase sigma-70 factor (ECF subfamily)